MAEHHAELLAHTRRSGRRRGPHDLMIAATAHATGRLLVTTDTKVGFGELPESRYAKSRPDHSPKPVSARSCR